MRAKLINEIKQNIEGSGLGPIGIGHSGMHKGYDYIKNMFPHSLSFLNKRKKSFHAASEEIVPEIKLFMPKILELMNCKEEELLISILNILAGGPLALWIESIMKHAEINIENEVTVKLNKLLYDINFSIRYNEEFNITEVHIESNEHNPDGSLRDEINAYYLIFIKYK